MSTPRDKLCMYCKHFYYDQPNLAARWSAPLPIIACNLNFMKVNWYEDGASQFRFKMTHAVRCRHYQPVKEQLERGY